MQGQYEREQQEHQRLDERLERMESEGCERSRLDRQVVHPVDETKNPWVMHEAMSPVKVGVMKKKHHEEAEPVPKPTLLFDFEVKLADTQGHQDEAQ